MHSCRTVDRVTELDATTLHTPEYWDGRYAAHEPVWSGKVNQRVVEQTADLQPDDAIDIGCGEGGDAVWLAQQPPADSADPVSLQSRSPRPSRGPAKSHEGVDATVHDTVVRATRRGQQDS